MRELKIKKFVGGGEKRKKERMRNSQDTRRNKKVWQNRVEIKEMVKTLLGRK